MSSKFKILLILICCLVTGSFLAAQVQQRKPKKPVTRAAKPDFNKNDWEGIFFEDLFAEGLVGPRPTGNSIAQSDSTDSTPTGSDDATVTSGGSGAWSELIDGNILENEVKRYQQSMARQLTTAGRFKTTHQEIRESFSMLATVFAIIGKFDGDVRWKDSAVSARFAFVDAAKNSRTPDADSFNNVKRRSDALTDLVRGSKFPDEPRAKPEFSDWAMVADRDAIMKRLEESVGDFLKEPTSSKDSFMDAQQKVIHEAGIMAALGRVLQQAEMLDADDEDYNALSETMTAAARDMREAATAGNYEDVNEALNRVNQSCTNCHAEWR